MGDDDHEQMPTAGGATAERIAARGERAHALELDSARAHQVAHVGHLNVEMLRLRRMVLLGHLSPADNAVVAVELGRLHENCLGLADEIADLLETDAPWVRGL